MAALSLTRTGLAVPERLVENAFEVAVLTRACPSDPDRVNEDSVLVTLAPEGSAVLLVADGVGGHGDGDVASSLVVDRVRKSLDQGSSAPRASLFAVLEQAHRDLLHRRGSAGTTVAVAVVENDCVRCYHAGDSAILQVSQRGRTKLRTIDHSPVGYAVEAGLLDVEDSLAHEERHLVSNFLGEGTFRLSITGPCTLARRDTLVVASDGLLDNLSEPEIAELIRKGPLCDAARRLADACQTQMRDGSDERPGKPDDLSFILLRRRI